VDNAISENITADISSKIDNKLSHKVSKGVIWVTITEICTGGLGFVKAIILARILAPSDFGLMAIVMSIMLLLQSTYFGFDSAIIQKQEKPEEFLNTAWSFELTRNLILFSILFLSAPLLSSLFNEVKSVNIFRLAALTLIFRGFGNIGTVYFRKNLDFYKQFILKVVPLVVNFIITISLTVILRNVWALVWASVFNSIISCAFSYIIHPYRPHFEFKINKIKTLFNFGKWLLGSSLISLTTVYGVNIFLGKFLGIAILGFYNRAETFLKVLSEQILIVIWQVGFPLFSHLQGDHGKLKRTYIMTSKLLLFIGIPLSGGLLILSRNFIHLFLTDRWLPILPIIQILCFNAIIKFISTPSEILFQSVGMPSINTKINAYRLIILGLGIYPLSFYYGLIGTAFSIFLSNLFVLPFVGHMTFKIARCSFLEFVKPILFSLSNTLLMVVGIYMIEKYIFVEIYFIKFFFLIFIGIIVYFIIAYFFDRYFNYGIYKLIKERVAALK